MILVITVYISSVTYIIPDNVSPNNTSSYNNRFMFSNLPNNKQVKLNGSSYARPHWDDNPQRRPAEAVSLRCPSGRAGEGGGERKA